MKKLNIEKIAKQWVKICLLKSKILKARKKTFNDSPFQKIHLNIYFQIDAFWGCDEELSWTFSVDLKVLSFQQ